MKSERQTNPCSVLIVDVEVPNGDALNEADSHNPPSEVYDWRRKRLPKRCSPRRLSDSVQPGYKLRNIH